MINHRLLSISSSYDGAARTVSYCPFIFYVIGLRACEWSSWFITVHTLPAISAYRPLLWYLLLVLCLVWLMICTWTRQCLLRMRIHLRISKYRPDSPEYLHLIAGPCCKQADYWTWENILISQGHGTKAACFSAYDCERYNAARSTRFWLISHYPPPSS